jgi:two-component system response regulator DegU
MGETVIKPWAVSKTESVMSVACENRWMTLCCPLFIIILISYGPAAGEISLRHALEHFNPDVVVADLSLPVSTKTNIARELKTNFPEIKVIIMSIHDERSVVDDVMASGIEGFVLKRRAVIDLIPAIRKVRQGHKYISPDATGES